MSNPHYSFATLLLICALIGIMVGTGLAMLWPMP